MASRTTTSPIHLKKTLGIATVWEKDVTVASVNDMRWLAMSGSELVFLSEKVNAIFVEALSCLEAPTTPTGCAAINITSGRNKEGRREMKLLLLLWGPAQADLTANK